MTEKNICANKINMNVLEYKKNKEAVLFLHCSRGNSAQWNGVIPFFKDKYYVITPDLRGHGQTDKPEDGYSLENMAKDIKELMTQLGVTKTHLIGSSMGGEVAAVFAATYPDNALSVTCEGAIRDFFGKNGFFPIPYDQIPQKKEEILNQLTGWEFPKFNTFTEMLNQEKQEYVNFNREWNEHRKQFVEHEIIKVDDMYGYSCTRNVLKQYTKNKFDIKFNDYFKKIKCPVLFLPSEEESKIEEVMSSINGYRDNLKKSQIKHIKGAIHAEFMFDCPKEFSEEVIDFIHSI